jgi:MFS family permease
VTAALGTGGSELGAHWRVVMAAALGAAAGITGMSVYSLSVLLGPLSDAFGWSRTEVSAAKTVLTAGFVLTAPLVGYLADRVGVRRLGLMSLAALAAGFFAMTQLGPNIYFFYAALFGLAVAGGATTALVWTRAVATWFQRSRGIALALTLTGPGITGVVTPAFLDAMIQRYDWRAAYIIMGLFALIVLVPLTLFFYENRRGDSVDGTAHGALLRSGMSVAEALRSRWFWQLGAGFLLVGAVVSALMVHLVPLIIGAGVTRNIAVRVAGAFGFAVIFGRLLTGWLVDCFHPPWVAAFFLAMPVAGCLVLAGEPGSMLAVIFAVACIGLAAGSEVDLVPYLAARYFGLKSYGRIYGWLFVAFYIGVGLGPLYLGYCFDRDGNYLFALKTVIPVLLAGVTIVATLGNSRNWEISQ